MKAVVLLNADYSPLGLISQKKAIKLLVKGKAEIVEAAERVIKNAEDTVRFLVPKVLKLIKFIRQIYKVGVPFSKRNVLVRDNFECQYCGAKNVSLTLDHVTPRSKGGKSTYDNVVAACLPCNNKKDNKTCTEAGMFLRSRPVKPTVHEFILIQVKRLGLDNVLKELGII